MTGSAMMSADADGVPSISKTANMVDQTLLHV
jgi:hypothetical protein